MPRPRTGKTHTSIRRELRKNGDTYLYERTTGYDPETKKTKTLSTVLVGVIRAGTTEVVPTRPKRKSKSQSRPVDASRNRLYRDAILDKIGEESGIDKDLVESFGEGDGQKIASIVRYYLATDGASLTRMATWQIENQVPYAHPISADMYGDLRTRIGQDVSGVQSYFLARAKMAQNLDSELLQIAVDSTTFSTYSESLTFARQGFNKDGDGLDTIKVLLVNSTANRQPIAFAIQPGNIPDRTSVLSTVRQLEFLQLVNALFVGDNGFYSQDNVAHLSRNNMDFLLLANSTDSWVKKAIEDSRDELKLMSHNCDFEDDLFGMTIPCTRSFGTSKNMDENVTPQVFAHIFYKESLAVEQKNAHRAHLKELKRQIEGGEEVFTRAAQAKIDKCLIVDRSGPTVKITFNEQGIADDQKNLGHFVLVSNKLDQPFVALKGYRRRETVEELIKTSKNTFEMRKPRVRSEPALFGRVFCQFVGLGYHSFFREKIEKIKAQLKIEDPSKTEAQKKLEQNLLAWLDKTSLVGILDWFGCVTRVTATSATQVMDQVSETTKRDRLFLELFGIEPV